MDEPRDLVVNAAPKLVAEGEIRPEPNFEGRKSVGDKRALIFGDAEEMAPVGDRPTPVGDRAVGERALPDPPAKEDKKEKTVFL